MSIHSLMNTTCTISTESQTTDEYAFNSAPILTPVSTNVPCRVTDQTADRAMVIYGKFDAYKQKRIYFDSDPNVTPAKSWIILGSTTFGVTSSMDMGGRLRRLWAVDVEMKPLGG